MDAEWNGIGSSSFSSEQKPFSFKEKKSFLPNHKRFLAFKTIASLKMSVVVCSLSKKRVGELNVNWGIAKRIPMEAVCGLFPQREKERERERGREKGAGGDAVD